MLTLISPPPCALPLSRQGSCGSVCSCPALSRRPCRAHGLPPEGAGRRKWRGAAQHVEGCSKEGPQGAARNGLPPQQASGAPSTHLGPKGRERLCLPRGTVWEVLKQSSGRWGLSGAGRHSRQAGSKLNLDAMRTGGMGQRGGDSCSRKGKAWARILQ